MALREKGAAAPESAATTDRAMEVHQRLTDHYGPPHYRRPLDPVGELVQTILSQNTSDVNSDRAFDRLMATFGHWDAILEAPVEEVAEAIRLGGLARVKAPRVKSVLAAVRRDRGEISLDFLRELDLEAGRSYLTSLDGVGPKTAACVLLFACGKPAMPVDTHVFRVARRLGLLTPKVTPERAHQELEAIVPADLVYAFHMNLIRHGRVTCKAQRPRCGDCLLADICPSAFKA